MRNQEPARLASAPCRTQQKVQGRLFLGIDTHALSVPAQTVSREKLRARLSDRGFRKEVDELLHSNREAMKAPAWFQRVHGNARLGRAVPLEAGHILWQR